MKKQIQKIVKKLPYKEKYIPHISEELDMYQVYNEEYGISTYAPTLEIAYSQAYIQAEAILSKDIRLLKKTIKLFKK